MTSTSSSAKRGTATRRKTDAAGSKVPAGERGQELKRVKDALAANWLVCHWLIRDRDRKLAALNAAREELDEVREERDAAILRRDAILAERAALDGELMRLVHRCASLAAQRRRGSAAPGARKHEREPTSTDVHGAQASMLDVRSERLDVRDKAARWSLVSSTGWALTEARATELFRSFARSTLGARTLALTAITVVSVVLLLLLTNR